MTCIFTLLMIISTFKRSIKSTVMEMVLIEIFCSYYVNKIKRYLCSHWQLSLPHYSVTLKISWRIESVNHLLDLKSLLNSSFICQILAGE